MPNTCAAAAAATTTATITFAIATTATDTSATATFTTTTTITTTATLKIASDTSPCTLLPKLINLNSPLHLQVQSFVVSINHVWSLTFITISSHVSVLHCEDVGYKSLAQLLLLPSFVNLSTVNLTRNITPHSEKQKRKIEDINKTPLIRIVLGSRIVESRNDPEIQH